MTKKDFLAFYPQFSIVPKKVLSSVITSANSRFSGLLDAAEEARRLYTAHKLTLYAKTSPGSAISLSSLASAGDGTRITSKKVENVAVTYSSSESTGLLGELEETIFGRQLLLLLKLSFPPTYIPG